MNDAGGPQCAYVCPYACAAAINSGCASLRVPSLLPQSAPHTTHRSTQRRGGSAFVGWLPMLWLTVIKPCCLPYAALNGCGCAAAGAGALRARRLISRCCASWRWRQLCQPPGLGRLHPFRVEYVDMNFCNCTKHTYTPHRVDLELFRKSCDTHSLRPRLRTSRHRHALT